jgi:hypothetical protein
MMPKLARKRKSVELESGSTKNEQQRKDAGLGTEDVHLVICCYASVDSPYTQDLKAGTVNSVVYRTASSNALDSPIRGCRPPISQLCLALPPG